MHTGRPVERHADQALAHVRRQCARQPAQRQAGQLPSARRRAAFRSAGISRCSTGGEIGAERKRRQQPLLGRRRERPRDALRRVVAARGRQLVIRSRSCRRPWPAAAVRPGSANRPPPACAAMTSRSDLAAQVGDAVFGHHDVAQMARDRGVAVVPEDVRAGLAAGRAGRAQHDDGAGVLQREALGDEIVLPADAAHHPAVLELRPRPRRRAASPSWRC